MSGYPTIHASKTPREDLPPFERQLELQTLRTRVLQTVRHLHNQLHYNQHSYDGLQVVPNVRYLDHGIGLQQLRIRFNFQYRSSAESVSSPLQLFLKQVKLLRLLHCHSDGHRYSGRDDYHQLRLRLSSHCVQNLSDCQGFQTHQSQ